MKNNNENPLGISDFGYGLFCGIFISLLVRLLIDYALK
jgi:hypothetical protein